GVANAVQQRRLAMVHVTENGHDGRSRAPINEFALLERLLDLLFSRLLLDDIQFDVVFEHQLDGGFGIDRRVDRDALADEEKLLENVGRLDAGCCGEVLDENRLSDLDLASAFRSRGRAMTAAGGSLEI